MRGAEVSRLRAAVGRWRARAGSYSSSNPTHNCLAGDLLYGWVVV